MESLLPIRIIEAVRLLHRLGYAGVRILPGINASGSAWRIVIFNVNEWDKSEPYGGPYMAKESCLYSTADRNIFNNHFQFPEDVSHVSVAEAILEGMPSLQRTALSQTGNGEYVHWYAQLASQVNTLADLPVAYADYFDDTDGWEIGWGSKRRISHPPAYTPTSVEQAEFPKRDEHYVLMLCAQYLGSQYEQQKTFPWLLGDPTKKSGKQSKLPVDGYWEEHQLIVEYHEKQHSEPVPFFDSKITATGIFRGEQRKIYDARKAQEVPKHGINLVIIDYRDFKHRKGKIVRNPEQDQLVVSAFLERASRNSQPGVTATFAQS
ncbi:hypothetical protein OF385_03280 [Glutamicibacter sp. JL.03c]|uniref:hypothetical protein n=1 Tax=Glutamicibacter sp. JL.03c TaxID=2984842 RepID=UPI0021F6A122|nr:hypothetical protein [Glutamicibacter sp. JL.03c]UYQ78196.1 hypothetical protein OF385_03280 [Glutamicibacter sp. JL.03c]